MADISCKVRILKWVLYFHFVIILLFHLNLFPELHVPKLKKLIQRHKTAIVPNIVHFIRFGHENLTFIDAVCILAAVKNQKPEKLYVHTDQKNFGGGKYWKLVMNDTFAREVVELQYLPRPKDIFGQQLNAAGYARYHASDVERLRILIKYGGIYLDNDSFIVRSLERFRYFEMTLGWQTGGGISDQAIVACKGARFLKVWLDSYKDYHSESWFYNAGIRPTQLLEQRPDLVLRLKSWFAEYQRTPEMIYLSNDGLWRSHFVIHLLINHQYVLTRNLTTKATYPVVFNETNILEYPANIQQMARDVFPFPDNKDDIFY